MLLAIMVADYSKVEDMLAQVIATPLVHMVTWVCLFESLHTLIYIVENTHLSSHVKEKRQII